MYIIPVCMILYLALATASCDG